MRHFEVFFLDQQCPLFGGLISLKYSFLVIEIFIRYIISQMNPASPWCKNSALQSSCSWRTSLTSRICQSPRSLFIFHARIWSGLGLHRFYLSCGNHGLFIGSWPCCVQKMISCSYTPPRLLYAFPFFFLQQSLSLWGGAIYICGPLRIEHSVVFYSPYLGQLRVSGLIIIYCK